jgi:hypothetical protein
MPSEQDERVIRRFGLAVVVTFGIATALPFAVALAGGAQSRPAADPGAGLAKSAQVASAARGD